MDRLLTKPLPAGDSPAATCLNRTTNKKLRTLRRQEMRPGGEHFVCRLICIMTRASDPTRSYSDDRTWRAVATSKNGYKRPVIHPQYLGARSCTTYYGPCQPALARSHCSRIKRECWLQRQGGARAQTGWYQHDSNNTVNLQPTMSLMIQPTVTVHASSLLFYRNACVVNGTFRKHLTMRATCLVDRNGVMN